MPITSMSDKILQRRRKRRLGRIVATGKIVFAFLFLAGVGLDAYHERHKDLIATSSAWQGFSMAGTGPNGTFSEWVGKVNEDGIPTPVIIADQRWEIVKVNHFSDAIQSDGKPRTGKSFKGVQAQTYCEQRVISYIPTANPRDLRSNLMHEIFHAGRCLHEEGDAWWNSAEEPKDASDHKGVYRLGEFMATFSHNNPEFMTWEAR